MCRGVKEGTGRGLEVKRGGGMTMRCGAIVVVVCGGHCDGVSCCGTKCSVT
jgi:hypothetical protein